MFPGREDYRARRVDGARLVLTVMGEEAAIELAESGELFIWPYLTMLGRLMFVFRTSEESNPSTIEMISEPTDCCGI